jgi:hypothetical protein
MAKPFGRDSRTQIKGRTSALQQVAGVEPARVRRGVAAAPPPLMVWITSDGEFRVLGARR